MPKLAATLLVAGALSGLITFSLNYWTDFSTETLLYSNADDGIEKVDVEFGRNTIHLNVYLTQPLTCKQVINKLGIETLPVKNRVYTPTCSTISGTLIKIVYTEAMTV